MTEFLGFLAAVDPNIPHEKLLSLVLEAGLGLTIDNSTHVGENESVVEEEFWTIPVPDDLIPDTAPCFMYLEV